MAEKKKTVLPRMGERIPAEQFHVSKTNVRYNQPFGESEKDKVLIEQMRRGEIIEPFKARPEAKGYGVYVGRRRLLAKKAVGVKAFEVGKDCLLDNIADEYAREASLIENIDILREEMDPIQRARETQNIIDMNMIGLRAVARRLGISPATISEWTKILELSPPMQEVVAKGLIYYKDALNLARMKLGSPEQDRLAEIALDQGYDAYKDALNTLLAGQNLKSKRGIPRGKYIVVRATFNKKHDMETYQRLEQLSKAKKMDVAEYCKWVLEEHVKSMF